MHETRAQLALENFTQKHPEATTIRTSIQNERGRWVTTPVDPDAAAGIIYRFQAYKGRNILGHDLYESPGKDDARTAAIGPHEETKIPHSVNEEAPPPVVEPLHLVERPAPVSGDPWLDLFRERMSADAVRIQELHRVVLSLVDSVSAHHQGATGPLVKLIDQLARNLGRIHQDRASTLDAKAKGLEGREAYVEVAEETAESKLIDAEEKAKENATESAIIQGVISHLAPTILEQLKP